MKKISGKNFKLSPLGGMTGQFSLLRRFRQNREALPLLGEVPSAHTGERGLRSWIRAGGKRQDAVPTILFPIGSLSAMATPQSRSRSTAPLRGEPRAETKAAALIYTSSAMNHAEIGATNLSFLSFRGGRSPTWESVSPWGNVWSWYGVWGCGLPRRSSLAPRNDRSVQSSAPF